MLYALMRFFVRLMVPVTRAVGMIHAPFSRKNVTGEDYYNAVQLLQPGMVILTRTYGELTTLLIPGYWNHAAIYAPNGNQVIDETVIEANHLGVHKKNLVTFLLTKDEFVILRPKFLDPEQMQKAADAALLYIGSDYDYLFDSNNKGLYCSELVFKSLQDAYGQPPFEMKPILGEPVSKPSDFYNHEDLFEVILIKDQKGLRRKA